MTPLVAIGAMAATRGGPSGYLTRFRNTTGRQEITAITSDDKGFVYLGGTGHSDQTGTRRPAFYVLDPNGLLITSVVFDQLGTEEVVGIQLTDNGGQAALLTNSRVILVSMALATKEVNGAFARAYTIGGVPVRLTSLCFRPFSANTLYLVGTAGASTTAHRFAVRQQDLEIQTNAGLAPTPVLSIAGVTNGVGTSQNIVTSNGVEYILCKTATVYTVTKINSAGVREWSRQLTTNAPTADLISGLDGGIALYTIFGDPRVALCGHTTSSNRTSGAIVSFSDATGDPVRSATVTSTGAAGGSAVSFGAVIVDPLNSGNITAIGGSSGITSAQPGLLRQDIDAFWPRANGRRLMIRDISNTNALRSNNMQAIYSLKRIIVAGGTSVEGESFVFSDRAALTLAEPLSDMGGGFNSVLYRATEESSFNEGLFTSTTGAAVVTTNAATPAITLVPGAVTSTPFTFPSYTPISPSVVVVPIPI